MEVCQEGGEELKDGWKTPKSRLDTRYKPSITDVPACRGGCERVVTPVARSPTVTLTLRLRA